MYWSTGTVGLCSAGRHHGDVDRSGRHRRRREHLDLGGAGDLEAPRSRSDARIGVGRRDVGLTEDHVGRREAGAAECVPGDGHQRATADGALIRRDGRDLGRWEGAGNAEGIEIAVAAVRDEELASRDGSGREEEASGRIRELGGAGLQIERENVAADVTGEDHLVPGGAGNRRRRDHAGRERGGAECRAARPVGIERTGGRVEREEPRPIADVDGIADERGARLRGVAVADRLLDLEVQI